MPLQLFNPWNDLALAANSPHYTPPASALQMAEDLADFSLLWSDSPHPWGWSPLAVRLLREAGVAEKDLPTVSQMAEYRNFASRQTAVSLLARLRNQWPESFCMGLLVGRSSWCESEAEILKATEEYGNTIMLKAPWSSSGRGVHPVTGQLSEKDKAWIQRTLKRQGGIEVEPLYNKVLDFAMEFWAECGHARYEGLSLFETSPGGVYAGNLVASEEEKERRLAENVPSTLLRELRNQLLTLLNSAGLPSWYTGPFGIDMMIVKYPSSPEGTDCRLAIHPLVELNLRMTMGWLAILLAQQQQPHEVRLFRIVQEGGRYHYELNVMSE